MPFTLASLMITRTNFIVKNNFGTFYVLISSYIMKVIKRSVGGNFGIIIG